MTTTSSAVAAAKIHNYDLVRSEKVNCHDRNKPNGLQLAADPVVV